VRKRLELRVSLLALSVGLPLAHAADYYASPSGSGSTCSEAAPCSALTAIGKPSAGDTVYFRGGTYTQNLYIAKSGTSSAWITFAAYPDELPVFQTTAGLGSNSGTYLRFVGLVSKGAATGFGNGWTGSGTTTSNGHFEFIDCIADGNTANGIAFRSATGVHISECIVAHNGSSTTASWSSGVDLYGAQGTYLDNVIERTVAFENVDNQQHTDGSGFIVDDIGTGATFVNNIGFRNGGSCIRLTTSSGTHLVNNTCYHDGLDTAAVNPNNPGEIFFSDATTRQGVVMVNNLAAAAGYNDNMNAIVSPPSTTVSNNVTVDKNGATPFFLDPAGNHVDLRLNDAAKTSIVDKGTSTEAPLDDIGFDPSCIVKADPGGLSWWIYSIDYTYIASIGGVAKCFAPKARSGAPDIGAYELASVAGSGGSGGTSGMGGSGGSGGAAAGSGGKAGSGGSGGAAAGAGGAAAGTGGTAAGTGGAAAGTSGGGAGSGGAASGGAGSGGAGSGGGGMGGAGVAGMSSAMGGALGMGGVDAGGGSVGIGGMATAAGGMLGAAGLGVAGATPSMAGNVATTGGAGPSAGGIANGEGGAPAVAGASTAGGTATTAGTAAGGRATTGGAPGSSAGMASDSAGAPNDSVGEVPTLDGCGCRVGGASRGSAGAAAALLLLGVTLARRRR
jgi:MYXO-CTERM domain-containing protein